jgi:hypothetical protein
MVHSSIKFQKKDNNACIMLQLTMLLICNYINVGCGFGIAHPPGYPLYTLIIHFLKSYVPFGTVAFRANILSSLCTVIASFCAGATMDLLCIDHVGKSGSVIITMGLFAFSPLVWQYAITAEVFAMNVMFAAILIYLTMAFSKSKSFFMVELGALICGLVSYVDYML